jgi:hypothetical protein
MPNPDPQRGTTWPERILKRVTSTPQEQKIIALARSIREQCICQEEPDAPPCGCTPPVTRDQLGRLRAYLALNADRAVIYSELASVWLAALHEFLPKSEDPFEAWLHEPFNVPEAADLHQAEDLGTLLDMLDAPAAAAMS